jgi:hypothetical protein
MEGALRPDLDLQRRNQRSAEKGAVEEGSPPSFAPSLLRAERLQKHDVIGDPLAGCGRDEGMSAASEGRFDSEAQLHAAIAAHPRGPAASRSHCSSPLESRAASHGVN